MKKIKQPIDPEKFEAVLFDLDGVITDSAKIHATCWKLTFDSFLKKQAEKNGRIFKPFDTEHDYLLYVDGKPRYEGVRCFLNSRNINLKEGSSDSPASEESIHGIGNRKNELVRSTIQNKGVEVYQSSIDLVKNIMRDGIKLAIVSSSRNCETILNSAGILHLFAIRIDGKVAVQKRLKGKPSPDTYLEAAKELKVKPDKAVVIEDSISGVQAGRNGNFGLVIGVARKNNADELSSNGADITVGDLGELIV